jgi:hypothetical protein
VAGDVAEGGRHLVLAAVGLRLALPELHDLVRPALGAHEDEPEERDQDDDRQHREEEADPLRRVADRHLADVLLEPLQQRVADDRGDAELAQGDRLAADDDLALGPQLAVDDAVVALDRDPRDAALVDQLGEGAEVDLARRAAGAELVEHEDAQDDQHHDQPRVEGTSHAASWKRLEAAGGGPAATARAVQRSMPAA